MGKQYAYIRVSSKEQNEERQRSAMREYDVPAENIILDKQSGKDFERLGYKKLLKILRPDPDDRAAGGHRRPGHAASGHAAKPRPHRRFDRGHRAAAA